MSERGSMRAELEDEVEAYRHGHDRPVEGYAITMLTFLAAKLAVGLVVRMTGRSLPERFEVVDLVLGGIATHKVARIFTKDAATSPVRVPFTRFDKAAGSGEVVEDVRGTGLRHTVGELLTCPFCVAPWIASAYAAGLTLAPRTSRTWAAVFTVTALSDVLQHVYARLRTD